MVEIKTEMPETLTLLNLMQQDILIINVTVTKIETQLDKTLKHIHSMINSLIGEEHKTQELIVNVVSSCFHMVENDLSTLKSYAQNIEERRSGIAVCLLQDVDPDHIVFRQELTDEESINCPENFQNKYFADVSGNDTIDEGNSDTDEYEMENICGFIDKIETGIDSESLKNENSLHTTRDSNDVSTQNNKLQVNGENFRLSSGGMKNVNIVFKDENMEISELAPIKDCFRCPECSETYSTEHNLERHISSKHTYDENDKILVHRCNKCDRSFSTSRAMKRHKRDTHPSDHDNFSCPVCNKIYSKKINFEHHMTEAHSNSEKVFSCEKCEKTFNTMLRLKYHLKTHKEKLAKPEKTHVCFKCSERFTDKLEYEAHMKLHLGIPFKYPCKLCKRVYTKRGHLLRHVDSFHSKPFKCSECGNEFEDSTSLKAHLTIHTGEKFSCELCNKKYFGINDKRKHIEKYHGMQYYMYANLTCEVCNKRFDHKGDLYAHLKTEHPDQKPFKCTECEKSFGKNGHLHQHMKSHTGDKPHQCQECEQCFRVVGKLKIHMRTHTGEQPYKCKQCDKSFSQSSTLQSHIHTHRDKLHQCPHCPEKFTLNRNLVMHIIRHTGKYPLLCEECGKGFTNKQSMTIHMRFIHTGERPFKCDQCKTTYASKSCLQRHVKGVHTEKNKPKIMKVCDVCGDSFKTSSGYWRHKLVHAGKRAHKCPHCPKDFTELKGLIKHIRTHTGEKPFKCEDCGKCFTQKTNLRVHRRCHTGEKPYVCECGKAFAHRVSLNSHIKSTGGACRELTKVNT